MPKKALGSIPALLVLLASRLSAAPCAPSDTALCLNASRFHAAVHWQDTRGRSGDGQAVSLTADTGYFWFFSPSNVELVVKVLDARTVNGKYWVFFGALSNVQYDLTVTDTTTGAVKAYHNPQNQFASVGDTGAFAGSLDAPSANETVEIAGTDAGPESTEAIQRHIEEAATLAAAEFTPCPEVAFGFLLNQCRFRIEVSWKDSRGRSGEGQPVQLTNDTGYFWFFSPSNVELMVKVLDARSVNGRFWVFFGALSNVEYSVRVIDSLTGASKRYANPSGSFASVGDTGAFYGGYSVAPMPDDAHAVFANFSVEGGRLTATSSDGTTFILEIPSQALTSPETVTLIPVSRIERLPFSGGFGAGVEIEPAGLNLAKPAVLTIQPASPISASTALPYSYAAGGEDFILYPRDPDSSSIRLLLNSFAGYGIGNADLADADAQASRTPTGPLAPYLQRYAREVYRFDLGSITRGQLTDSAVQIYDDAFTNLVAPLLDLTGQTPGVVRKAETCIIDTDGSWKEAQRSFWGLFSAIRSKQLMNIPDIDPSTGKEFLALQEAIKMLQACLQRAFDRCVSRDDPYEALWMLYISQQLQVLGLEDPRLTTFVENGLLERCLRFELDFQSKFVDEAGYAGYSYTRRVVFRSAHLPLRFQYAGNPYAHREAWNGGCALVPELATEEFNRKPCTVNCSAENSWMDVPALWLDGFGNWDPANVKVFMFYDPGAPVVRGVEVCPLVPPSEPTTFNPDFATQYWYLHLTETVENFGGISSGFFAKNWALLRTAAGPSQNGSYLARKSYERTKALNETETLTEETHIFLRHTPDAPMPDCH